MSWLVENEVGTVVVGEPRGITTRACGHRQNLALRNWRRTHLLACLSDKAELAGIGGVLVNERGRSSTCPEDNRAVPKPGRAPARRDRGRHRFDGRRARPAPGRPRGPGSCSPGGG